MGVVSGEEGAEVVSGPSAYRVVGMSGFRHVMSEVCISPQTAGVNVPVIDDEIAVVGAGEGDAITDRPSRISGCA